MSDFINQTAKDYDMEYDQVEYIYNIYPTEFYEKLEEFIKRRNTNHDTTNKPKSKNAQKQRTYP